MATRVLTGIDLGLHAVRFVTLEVRKKTPRLVTFDSEMVGEASAPEGTASRWAQALRTILKRTKLRPAALGRVAASVGGESLTVRQIDLPDLSNDDLASAMPLEARRHVPLPAEIEIALSYQVLHRDTTAKRVNVLLGACPKSLVQDAVRGAAEAGIEPELVDAAPLAAMNAILHARGEQEPATGYLDVDGQHDACTLVLMRPPAPYASLGQPVSTHCGAVVSLSAGSTLRRKALIWPV